MPNMVKSKASSKWNEGNDFTEIESVASSRAEWTPEPQSVVRIVGITVDTIGNIVREDSVNVTILVYHNEVLLGESQPVRIEPDFRDPPPIHRIDYSTEFPINVTDRSEIGIVVCTPLLIQVVEHSAGDGEIRPVSSAAGDSKKKNRSNKSSKKSAEPAGPQILGLCNLDLMPILLGEKTVTESLIVEKPDNIVTSWLNLPVLTVTLAQHETDFFPSGVEVNYLSITVESIHNSPLSFASSLANKAATIIFTDREEPETLVFNAGKFSRYRDVEKTKRWRTLSKYESRARLSKYKIDSDYANIKNSLGEPIDLAKVLENDNPRIEWNYLNRQILLNPGQQAMKDKINKFKYWPFQFMLTSSSLDDGKAQSKDHRPQIYQCCADVSELLYPGKTETRTVAQLYTYNSSDMLEKTGFDKLLFPSEVAIETKQKEKKGKLSAKVVSSVDSPAVEPEVTSGSPLTNEKGEPVFVVVQFELKNPLNLARTTEELTHELHELLGPPDKLPLFPYTGDLPEEQYFQCIRRLVGTITESYRDEIDQFTQYLYDTGTYTAVQNSLKKRITRLLDQKFKIQSCTWNSEECQNLVTSAYVYLVEQMHAALHSDSEGVRDSGEGDDSDDLSFSAEESYELGNIPQAKTNYLRLISAKRKDPESWLKYAIFLKKIGDVDRAVQCCREAIKLNARHKLALLLYGVILATSEDYKAAEIFLKAATQLYPRFVEGWAILHLFYVRIEYYPGVDLAIRAAEQCLKEPDREIVGIDWFDEEPFAWSTTHCPQDRVYFTVIVFLLKLNLFDFAGTALGRELALNGKSTSWLYYMAVHHYLQGRFNDALTHLKEAQREHGMDYPISSLMGHCHFKEGNCREALECYEFASTLFNRPTDIRLVDLRLGNFYLEAEQYARAKKIFLNLCKTSPSSSSWLGLGTSFYNTMNLKDAETALTEANRLDHTNPETWGYLCLLNMSMDRQDEFTECYRQAMKNDLQNAKLWLLITDTMKSLGFASQMLSSGDIIVKESSEKSTGGTKVTPEPLLKSKFSS